MPRSREEIMRDLKAILAELDYAMGSGPDTDPDISPKLAQALKAEPAHAEGFNPDTGRVERVPLPPKTHDEIRAQARAYKPADYTDEIPAKPRKPADYTARDRPADDPDWPPDAVWLGTGDHKLIE